MTNYRRETKENVTTMGCKLDIVRNSCWQELRFLCPSWRF